MPQGFRSGERMSVHAVACDVYRDAHPGKAEWDVGIFTTNSDDGINTWSTITMPPPVWKWYGFAGSDPLLKVRIKYSSLRPEVDGQIAAALAEAERQEKDLRERLLPKYRAWESWWKETRSQYHEQEESLMALNDELQMTFEQIASVLTQNFM